MQEQKQNTGKHIAFLFSAYTDAQHLIRLIDHLPDHSHFYIHIDKKSDVEPFLPLEARANVTFIADRTAVYWGNISQVEYQMKLFRAALQSNHQYDYLCTLSGMEYPVWSKEKITDYFANQSGTNILKGICLCDQEIASRGYRIYRPFAHKPWANKTMKNRIRVILRHLLSPILHKPLTFHANGKTYRLYKGSDWFAIRPDLARYILDTWDSSPQLRQYFRSSFAPSETFVHTVAFNSIYASSCMEIRGEYESLSSLTPLTYFKYGKTIKILTEADYADILSSGKMFCRKVVSGESNHLMDMLDIVNSTSSES